MATIARGYLLQERSAQYLGLEANEQGVIIVMKYSEVYERESRIQTDKDITTPTEGLATGSERHNMVDKKWEAATSWPILTYELVRGKGPRTIYAS